MTRPRKTSAVEKKLVGVADVVITAAQRRKDPTLAIPIRALSNVSFNERRGLIEMGKRKQARSFFNVGMAKKFMQTVLVADALCELQRANLTTSLREIYYRTKHTIKDSHENTLDTQDESDPIIEDLEVTLTALREELHVRAENAGSIVGPVVFVDDGDRVDCTRLGKGGYSVPSIVEPEYLQIARCTADFVLLVEKGTQWNRLSEDKFWRRYNCVLLTGNGQPPRGVRRLARRLHEEKQLPVYVLVDNDPWGYYIYSVIKQGSINLAFESQRMAIPKYYDRSPASTAPSRCKGTQHGRPILGYARVRGQAGANHAALRRQHVLRGGPGRRWHADRSRLRDRRSRTGTGPGVRGRAALRWSPDDHPHPLGSHPGIPVFRAALHPGEHVGHLCSGGARTATRTDAGRTNGVQLLPRHSRAARGEHSFPRSRRGALHGRGRAHHHAVSEPPGPRARLSPAVRRQRGGLLGGSRAARPAPRGQERGGAARARRGPASRRIPRRRRPGHSRRSVHGRGVSAEDGLGSHACRVGGRLRPRRPRQAPGPVSPRPAPRRRRGGSPRGGLSPTRQRRGQRAAGLRRGRGPSAPAHRARRHGARRDPPAGAPDERGAAHHPRRRRRPDDRPAVDPGPRAGRLPGRDGERWQDRASPRPRRAPGADPARLADP